MTVTGFSPILKTDRADVSTRFDTKELTELPVLDRNFTKFILLTPGAQQLGWQHAPSENPQGSTQTQVNGQHFSGTGYQLDGTENRDPILGIIVINPNLESIGETKITSQNYDAEFGQATAGVVAVQTKSGSNTFRGSGFEFFQNEALQARNPFTQSRPDPTTGKFIPDSKKNQFGGSVGGPIIENKWFFFGDYQGTRQDRGGSVLTSVPTVLARAGNFSEYGQRIFNPVTGQEYANATIPQGQLSPQALNIIQLIPTPNAPGRENGTRDNFTASGIEAFTQNSTNVRIDGRLSDSINTFGRYSLGKFHREGTSAFGRGGGPAVIGGGNLGGISESRNQSLAYGVDYAISSSLLADFRFGWFQYKVDVLPGDFGTTPAADAGIPNLNKDTNFTSGLPYFGIRGNQADMDWGWSLNDNAGRCNCPLNENEKQWQVVTNLTKLWGSHTSKFGVDIRRAYNLRIPSDQHRSGQLTFNALRTSNAGQGGLGLATFLLGDVANGTDRGIRPVCQYEPRCARAAMASLLLCPGHVAHELEADAQLRAAPRRDQPANGQRGAQRDVGRSHHRSRSRGGCGRHRPVREYRKPTQLGAACRRNVSSERKDCDPRRLRAQLRHRCVRFAFRPHSHAEPARSGSPKPDGAQPVCRRVQSGPGSS